MEGGARLKKPANDSGISDKGGVYTLMGVIADRCHLHLMSNNLSCVHHQDLE